MERKKSGTVRDKKGEGVQAERVEEKVSLTAAGTDTGGCGGGS